MKFVRSILVSAASLALVHCGAISQEPTASQSAAQSRDESGYTDVGGRNVSYLIRRLPVDSFPELPGPVAAALNQRGCLIPQTWQAHHPENVIRASFERSGSSDWAVLCSTHGEVELLVFFGRTPTKPFTLATFPELQLLQRHGSSGVFGFDWGIDVASPQQVREAQAVMEHHPPLLDHDALAGAVLNEKTVYHFFVHNAWTVIDVPD